MKEIYLKPEALVEAMETENLLAEASLAIGDGEATGTGTLSREFDIEDFSHEIIFIDAIK